MVPWSMVHDCIDRTIMDRLACFAVSGSCYDLYDSRPRSGAAAGFPRTAIARHNAGHASSAWVKAEPRGAVRGLTAPARPNRTACGSEARSLRRPLAHRCVRDPRARRPPAPPARETATELGTRKGECRARRAAAGAPRRQRYISRCARRGDAGRVGRRRAVLKSIMLL
jgi:hypothetical protein